MAKYLVRLYCTVEVPVEADNIKQAMDACDPNNNDLNQMVHIITGGYGVVEVEPVLSKGDEYDD